MVILFFEINVICPTRTVYAPELDTALDSSIRLAQMCHASIPPVRDLEIGVNRTRPMLVFVEV